MANRQIEHMGVLYPSIAALARELNMAPSTIRRRLNEARPIANPRDEELKFKRANGMTVGQRPGTPPYRKPSRRTERMTGARTLAEEQELHD